ncbi:AAA family ATPase [Streptococcus mutans]|nr:AAA family ATPase [Streptococcus mutans]MCB4992007.1 AAA family ATPase [Streptococcus mutans]MCB4997752.1 AAA family ATPase [Streptococcus mutans]MCB5065146.1 AAA family ATPase [Streptococcus mutans]MCB5108956.1 AAA family ATPase [Streptococcus mutans]
MTEFDNLEDVAVELKDAKKNIKLVYAFNGTGKTRLSMLFKGLIQPQVDSEAETSSLKKILYYNAFTEDLFTWDNDLENGSERKLLINANSEWIRKIITVEGDSARIVEKFQDYVLEDKEDISEKIEAEFNADVTAVSFRRNYQSNLLENIKISRGEESNFIWSVFYILMEFIIEQRSSSEEDRRTHEYDELEYIFIDDPVSSLDDRRIIDVALDLAHLLKESNQNDTGLKFIITTHHALFFNVLFNELKNNSSKFLLKKTNQKYLLNSQDNDAPFAYHLMLVDELKEAIFEDRIEKYHFNLLRNLLEKTATFLGYKNWGDCVILRDEDGNLEESAPYVRRINLHSHSAHSDYETRALTTQEKKVLERVFNQFLQNFSFNNVE